jgi:hypothetical protein
MLPSQASGPEISEVELRIFQTPSWMGGQQKEQSSSLFTASLVEG